MVRHAIWRRSTIINYLLINPALLGRYKRTQKSLIKGLFFIYLRFYLNGNYFYKMISLAIQRRKVASLLSTSRCPRARSSTNFFIFNFSTSLLVYYFFYYSVCLRRWHNIHLIQWIILKLFKLVKKFVLKRKQNNVFLFFGRK